MWSQAIPRPYPPVAGTVTPLNGGAFRGLPRNQEAPQIVRPQFASSITTSISPEARREVGDFDETMVAQDFFVVELDDPAVTIRASRHRDQSDDRSRFGTNALNSSW
jgi:hypothetical protein